MSLKRQPGKNIVLLTAVVLSLLALLSLIVAFVTPYWVISWPRIFSEFKRIGLWEACFAGLVLDWDANQKAYHGCWWILADEFKPIRNWMMPFWFVMTQLFVTLCLVAEFVGIIFLGMMYSNATTKNAMGQVGEKRQPWYMVQAATYITYITAFVMTFTILLFANCFYWDKNWMPRKDLNYLSFSYGMAVLSTFFSIFSSIAIGNYHRIIQREYTHIPAGAALNLSRTSAKI